MRSTRIALQASACTLFGMIYLLMKTHRVESTTILKYCYVSSSIGLSIYVGHAGWRNLKEFGYTQTIYTFVTENREKFQVTMYYLLGTFVLAPIFRTLTATVSSDTVQAVSTVLLVLHLMTNDFGVRGFFVSPTLSVCAALFAAITLSSRLPTNTDTIALTTLGVELFLLFPIFSSFIWDSYWYLAVVILGVASVCLYTSLIFIWVYTGTMICITLVLPLTFWLSKKFKYQRHGPWDEAVIKKY